MIFYPSEVLIIYQGSKLWRCGGWEQKIAKGNYHFKYCFTKVSVYVGHKWGSIVLLNFAFVAQAQKVPQDRNPKLGNGLIRPWIIKSQEKH